ncbi:unnamed protein product, partial [Brassica rapa]
MCTDGQPRTSCAPREGQRAESKDQPTDVLCVLMDTHRHTRTATDVFLCVLTDTHRRPIQPQTSCVCWRTLGPKLPKQSTGRVSVLSPRTNVLICVLMDSHGRPMCADGHTRTATDVLCVLTDTHGRPPQTSFVCWRTPTDVLCVLNRQPTWTKITQTVHGKGSRAESKDQRADMCTDGQPQTSCVPLRPKSPKQSTGRVSVLSPRTNVLICVLTNTHGRPVCADGHTQTSCVHHVCADGHTRTATDVLCLLMDSHRQPQTSCVPKSPKQSTGRGSVLSPRTNVLICVLMDSHRRPVCADGHTQTHTDSHRRPVCAGGHTRTSCVCLRTPTDVLPHVPKSPKHSTGRVSVLSP